MLEQLFVNYIGFGIISWVLLYISDYYLTIAAARLYQTGVKDYITFDGSYELTPYYQEDVDNLRTFSPRFLWSVMVGATAFFIGWVVAVHIFNLPQLFSFMLGTLILLEAAVHLRHLRNIVLFRWIVTGEAGLTGQIQYPRPLSLKLSAVELFGFGVFFLASFFLTGSWFFLGGTLSCLITGQKHWLMAKQARQAVGQV